MKLQWPTTEGWDKSALSGPPPVAFHCRGGARGACLNAWTWALWMFPYTLGADPKGEGLKASLGIV